MANHVAALILGNLYQFGQLVPLFLDVKNDVLTRITEPSENDYDNDGSDNYDYNFVTFDDLRHIGKYHEEHSKL